MAERIPLPACLYSPPVVASDGERRTLSESRPKVIWVGGSYFEYLLTFGAFSFMFRSLREIREIRHVNTNRVCGVLLGLLTAVSFESHLQASEKAVRVMPMGDSITASIAPQSSYRFHLWRALKVLDYCVDFVGSQQAVFQSSPGKVMASPWEWSQHGECGRWMSGLVPRLAECVDDIAFIHSMTSRSNVHGPATFLESTALVPAARAVRPVPRWQTTDIGSIRRSRRPRGNGRGRQ